MDSSDCPEPNLAFLITEQNFSVPVLGELALARETIKQRAAGSKLSKGSLSRLA